MALYCGIDLHDRDHMVVVIDETDTVILERRLSNDLEGTLELLEPLRSKLEAVAVESTFNWYWLVDGLEAARYTVKLVNTSAVEQYNQGLRQTIRRNALIPMCGWCGSRSDTRRRRRPMPVSPDRANYPETDSSDSSTYLRRSL